MDRIAAAVRIAAAALLAACAAAPSSPLREGEDEVGVRAFEFEGQPDELIANLSGMRTLVEVRDVACTLENDRGHWIVMTPGKAHVVRSSEPLRIECTKEGFRTVQARLRCTTRSQRTSSSLPLSIVAIAGGIVTLPVGGASLIAQGGLGVAEHAYEHSKPDACIYESFELHLERVRNPAANEGR